MDTLFIGRWQPLHQGHIRLIKTVLEKGESVVIAIRDTNKDEKNPYSVRERKRMIKRVFGKKVKIIVIPDVNKVCIGRDVGYEVIRLPYDIEQISGTKIRKRMRESSKVTEPFTVWFTGLSKSGKTTLAYALRRELIKKGIEAVCFDGNVVRNTLWPELGFTKKDREENVKRVTALCKALKKEGKSTVVSLISPYRKGRDKARQELKRFIEVYTKCPIKVCIERDEDELYEKAKKGEIKNFTGISDPYEEPFNPEVICRTDNESIEKCIAKIIDKIFSQGAGIGEEVNGRLV